VSISEIAKDRLLPMFPRFAFFSLALISFSSVAAEPQPVRPVPPPGIAVPDPDRKELEAGVAALGKAMDDLRTVLKDKGARLADVQIFHKAVNWALRYDEFFDAKQIATAKAQLAMGMQRVKELREGKPSWESASGLVVRGYISKIDGSVQPYGLVIPEDWKPADKTPRRLDFWMHGRGEKLSELAFLDDRMKNKGEFTPPGAIVLHLYGRYCCANKFAGEVDLFEALDDARKHYPIDMNRLVVRGFSMGGASTWQFATHHAGMWAAAAPGAGFAETAEFFKVFAPGKEPPPPWEQVLWRWYDSTLYAANLANCPTVAYSGEIDGQKQAADIMIRYAEKEGVTIPHIIGPQTAHKYHPDSKPKIEEFVTKAAGNGRILSATKVRFVTHTLIYPEMKWGRVTGLEKHWERVEVNGERGANGAMVFETKNVSSLTVTGPPSGTPVRTVILDGQEVGKTPFANPSYFVKRDGKWQFAESAERAARLLPALRKQPGLCGPIDHALMSSFIMVRPTGQPLNGEVAAWAKAELEHATEFWRRVFRGEAPLKDDTALSADDVAKSNLVLWGDPSSNAVLRKIADKLPLRWNAQTLEFNGTNYDVTHYAPILIFPNPLNPQKYVVLNSGVTFREQALLNNSDQTPKLPDWAVVDLRTPPGPKWPGLVVDAGFFDENWRLPERKK
jgi:hypothetical protein